MDDYHDNVSDNTSLEDLLAMYDNTSNESYTASNILLIIVYIPVFLVAIFGNGIVLLVILMDVRMRRSPANCFLVNLAISDFLVAMICIPITAVNYVHNVWVLGTTLCKVTGYMQGVCIVSSVLTIVLMSFDRYFAIRHPMKNKQIFTIHRVRRLIMMTWVSAAIIVIPIAIVNQVVSPEFNMHDYYCTEMWPSHALRQIYDLAFLLCVYFVPGCATVVLYTLVGCRLWAKDRHLQRQNSTRDKDDVLIARRKVALMMIIISVLFLSSWLPYYALNILFDFEADDSGQLLSIYPFAIFLGHSNCAQNPILYCFMHKSFRSFVLKAFRCQCRKASFTRSLMLQGSYGSASRFNSFNRRSHSQRQGNMHQRMISPNDVIRCNDDALKSDDKSNNVHCV